ncbi:C-type lectin 1-like [Liasis olivaceus]
MGRFAFVRLGLLLVALPLSATGAPKSCSSSWFTYKKSCYKIFLKAKTWHYAEKFCRAQKRGCHLASIHDAAESDSLAKYLSPRLSMINIWIGLRASKKGTSTGTTTTAKSGALSSASARSSLRVRKHLGKPGEARKPPACRNLALHPALEERLAARARCG